MPNLDLIRTFKITDDTYDLGTSSGIDTVSGFTATAPQILIDIASGTTGTAIIPKTLQMWIVGTAPTNGADIYIVGDTKARYVSGGTSKTIRSPSFSFGATTGAGRPGPNTSNVAYASQNSATITANSSTTAELIDTITLVGGTTRVGFTYQFERDVAIGQGCSLLIYTATPGATAKMKFSLWFQEGK